jgi:VanZ family protein
MRTGPSSRRRLDVRRLLFAGAVVAQLVALYWPRPVETGSTLPIDKVVHALIFGAVMWTGARAGLPPRPLAAVLAVHAGVSEVLQATVLDRDGNLPDAVADVAGIALAWALLAAGSRSRNRNRNPIADGAARRP